MRHNWSLFFGDPKREEEERIREEKEEEEEEEEEERYGTFLECYDFVWKLLGYDC